MSWSFIEHATDYMRRRRLGDKKAPTLWPSEASAVITNSYGEREVVGKCRRAIFFRYAMDWYGFSPQYSMYAPLVEAIKKSMDPTDPYMLWIWRAGELYEEHCIDLAKSSGVYIADQVQVYVPDLNLSGKIDLVVINPKTGKFIADEIKSVYGFNANYVLGTPTERKKGVLGTPKDSNLMQIALYDWHVAKNDPQFEDSHLTYGARDTGRYAEYEIRTEPNSDGLIQISYRGISPSVTPWVVSPITISSIHDQYRYITACLESGHIPERDYHLQFSDEQIQKMYERKELNKVEAERVEKRNEQISQGKDRINKQIEKGNWQCAHCSFAKVCYDSEGNPRSI